MGEEGTELSAHFGHWSVLSLSTLCYTHPLAGKSGGAALPWDASVAFAYELVYRIVQAVPSSVSCGAKGGNEYKSEIV